MTARGGQARNADFISIARRAIHPPLNPLNLLNPLNPGRLRRSLFPRHHRHGQDDEGHAHELPETEGEVEDEEGENDG